MTLGPQVTTSKPSKVVQTATGQRIESSMAQVINQLID